MILVRVRLGLLGESGAATFPREIEPGLTPRRVHEEFRAKLPQSVPIELALNGRRLEHENELDRELVDGDDLMLLPVTGEVTTILIIASIVLSIASGVMQALSPRPKVPGIPAERGDESSPTYAWDGIATNYGQGFPVPFVYGRHAVGGQVIYTDVFANTAGGTIDDRLRLILALCEGPIARIGDTVAAELDDLGGLVGGQPGSPLPSEIRVNGSLLESQVTAVTVTNVLLATGWSGTRPQDRGDLLEVWDLNAPLPNPPGGNGPLKVGLLQIVEIRNPQSTDLDVLVLDGVVSPGFQLRTVGSTFATAFVDGLPPNTQRGPTQVQRTNLNPGARAWIRPGTLDQNPLPPNPFRGTSVTFSPNADLAEALDESIFTYEGDAEITTVGFVVAFPSGCFAQDPQGSLLPYPVLLEFAWRPQGSQSWRLFYTPGTQGLPLRSRTLANTPRVGPLLDSWGADLVRAGDLPVNGPIEIRLLRRTPSGGTDSSSRAVWRNVFVNSAHVLAYPRVALLGLELSAGARFSGGLPNIVTRIDGAKVRLWDPTHGWSPRTWDAFTSGNWAFSAHPPGRNPAWILLDFLLAPWGLGSWLTEDDLDLPSFRRWAAFCDTDPSPSDPWGEPAFQCDLVGDQPRPAWDWVLAICAAGRAAPTARNGKIGVVYQYRDAHGDNAISIPAKSATQLLTSGNCEDAQVTWLPKANRPTALQFQFLNQDQLYTQDVLVVEDDEGTLNDPTDIRQEEWRPETIQAFGVTRPSQIYREGKFRHRVQRLIRREVSFVTGRWALAAEVGDLIEFEHELLRPFGADVPMNMAVLVGGSGVNVVTVDHDATGATQIVLRDVDGLPQRRDITGLVLVEGTTEITFSGSPVDVNPGATCVVGLADKLTETYEIIAINLRRDLKREVRAVQWVPEIHDEVTPSQFAGTGVDEDGPAVDGLLLEQPPQEGEPELADLRVVPRRDGTHLVVWSKPPNRRQSTVRVYLRDVDATEAGDWSLAGETALEELAWPHFVPGRTYLVSACLEGLNGQHALPEFGEQLEFVPEEFPPFSPPEVTNARAIGLDEFALLQWDDLDVRDLDYYEVRLGTCWTAGQVLHRARAPRVLLANPPGGGTVLVAARSTSGLYGNPVALVLPAWGPRNQVAVVSHDDFASSPTGTHDGTEWVADEDCIALQVGELTGQYTSAELDVGYQAPVYWQVQVDRAELENVTLDELTATLDSGEARWTTVHGRPASAMAAGVDWQTRVDDMTLTLDDAERRSDLLVQGPVGEIGSHTRVLIESRFETGGAWSAWAEHQDRTVVARKMQVRATLERSSDRYEARVTALALAAYL